MNYTDTFWWLGISSLFNKTCYDNQMNPIVILVNNEMKCDNIDF